MTLRCFILLCWAAAAVAQTRVPVLVELFTSEGCSSCPPADDLLARLDGSEPIPGVEIISLGEHVDYWDHQGWRDRFSSALFSTRQAGYARSLGVESPYTPQAVIDGREQCNGADQGAVQRAIRRVMVLAGPRTPLEMKQVSGDTLSLRAGPLPPKVRGAEILIAVAEGGLLTNVERGENAGRRLRHAAVVRSLVKQGKLGPSNESAVSQVRLTLQPEWNRRNLKVVAIVQDSAGRVLGAASLSLGGLN